MPANGVRPSESFGFEFELKSIFVFFLYFCDFVLRSAGTYTCYIVSTVH